MSLPRVLVVEENMGLARVLAFKMRTAGMLPTVCRDAAEAWDAFQLLRPAAIVCDQESSGPSACALAERVRGVASADELPFVLVTGRHSATDDEALRTHLGISHVLAKPVSPTELCELLRELIATTAV